MMDLQLIIHGEVQEKAKILSGDGYFYSHDISRLYLSNSIVLLYSVFYLGLRRKYLTIIIMGTICAKIEIKHLDLV